MRAGLRQFCKDNVLQPLERSMISIPLLPATRYDPGQPPVKEGPGGASPLPAAGGILLAFVLTFVLAAATAWALDVPRLKGRINDYAGMLSPETANRLDAQLADLERTDSTQVVVLTIPSLEGQSLEEYSIKVAQAWGIGQKGKDNGALLLVSKADRKVRIEVGYGLEGVLTDALSGRIISQNIVPAFKAGNFDAGIQAGVSAVIAAVRGEYQGSAKGQTEESNDEGAIFGIIMLAIILSAVLRGLPTLWRAGIFGVLLPVVGLVLSLSAIVLLLLLVGGILLGILGPILLSSGRGGGGGFFIGGGGSGGGGFSGGGGSFGGGGSSGSW
jgi:uncharacterized protein